MNILILGGTQAFGTGLPISKSYVGQLARRLRTDGHSVQVDQYGPLLLEEAGTLLSRLRLYQYDCILLQLGDAELRCLPNQRPDLPPAHQLAPAPAGLLFGRQRQNPDPQLEAPSWVRRQLGQLHLWLRGNQTIRMRTLRHQLATVLMMVQPYRHQTLLLSPLPQRRSSRTQQLVRDLFLEEARLWDVASLDTAALLCQDELLFQDDTTDALNELAHELLGSTLHTLVTEQQHALPPSHPRWRRPSTP